MSRENPGGWSKDCSAVGLDRRWSISPRSQQLTDEDIVETHMSRLRTKLNEGGRGDAIRTVRGSGYMVLSSGTAQGIIEGDYAPRVPVDGSSSEFDRISTILNQMLGRIEELMGSLRQVSSDLAHDMRTPLGRIRQDMERLATATNEPDTSQSAERATVDIDALLDLFAGLLGGARGARLCSPETLCRIAIGRDGDRCCRYLSASLRR
ncbi:winged helix-turn-helix domain-containing protein [Sphingobium sp. DN12]|uniref:winged helix-turn-helix domain-containing protein n=1 Tax=Sphingobium sp. DN12 TaxID=3378073 RepID=UPI003DA20515